MKKALEWFRRLEYILLVLPMAFLCICIVVNIFMRAFLDSGLAWLEELSRYIFVFSTFLGASIAIETGQHPKMTAVTDALHNKPRYAVLFIGNLFCAALSFLVAFYGYQQILRMIPPVLWHLPCLSLCMFLISSSHWGCWWPASAICTL